MSLAVENPPESLQVDVRVEVSRIASDPDIFRGKIVFAPGQKEELRYLFVATCPWATDETFSLEFAHDAAPGQPFVRVEGFESLSRMSHSGVLQILQLLVARVLAPFAVPEDKKMGIVTLSYETVRDGIPVDPVVAGMMERPEDGRNVIRAPVILSKTFFGSIPRLCL